MAPTRILVASFIVGAVLVASDVAVVATLGDRSSGEAIRTAVPSSGCGHAAPVVSPDEAGSLMVNGVERTWRTHVPPAHDGMTPVPLVLLLHGLGEDSGIIRYFTASGLPDQEGFVIVAPLGSGLISRWMWDLGDSEYDLSLENPDIAFIAALIDHLGSSLCLDESRIYAAGYSNGAIGVSALGCVLEGRIAAIAPVAALTDFGEACVTDRPVPVLGIQGTEDPYVLYEGGWGEGLADFTMEDFVTFADQPITSWPGFQLSFAERMANLAARNGCAPEHTSTFVSEEVELQAWDCPVGADTEFLAVHGAGHAWPSIDVDASAAIWEFFSRQALTAEAPA